MKTHTYHYSYEFTSNEVRLYGDGIATMNFIVNNKNYDYLKKSIFEYIENKDVIGDFTKLHIISLSKL